MENQKTNTKSYWNKVPLILRSVILGLAISAIGVISWPVIGTIIPMPWSFIIMIGLLTIYILFFSGRKWHPKSAELRKVNFRGVKLSNRQWIISLFAAALIVLIEQSGLVVTFRIIEFPAEMFTQAYSFLDNIPQWAGWLAVIMISIVAGICEEVGFRGYMQLPLENKYGPIAGIAIVSVVIVLVHLHQAWAGPIIIHIFLVSVLFGAIAYFSGSLIPGIIAHIVMDVFNFSFWWTTLGRQFSMDPINTTGVDSHFVVWTTIFILGCFGFIILMSQMKKGADV